MRNIAKRDFQKVEVPVPPDDVQDEIAEAPNLFDAKIEADTYKLQTSREVNKWLLQNLLTGRIRLPEDF